MENGHVADHIPITDHTATSSSTNGDALAGTTSDTASMEDTVEYRILMAYVQRRRPKLDLGSSERTPDAPSPQTPTETNKDMKGEKEKTRRTKKKNRLMKALGRILPCVKPQTEVEDVRPPDNNSRSFGREDDGVDTLELVASRLTTIADEIPFSPPEIEADGDDNVEKMIGLLLRESGDKFNESVMKDVSLSSALMRYGFFESVISTFLERMGFATFNPDALGPQGSPKTQIALTCEVASRLSAADTLPMSRLLGFGAKYLQTHYSTWAAQQGGYEDVFDGEDDEEVN